MSCPTAPDPGGMRLPKQPVFYVLVGYPIQHEWVHPFDPFAKTGRMAPLIVRILFYNHCLLHTGEHFSCRQFILYQFIVSMLRYPDIAGTYQITHPVDELTQFPFSISAIMIPLSITPTGSQGSYYTEFPWDPEDDPAGEGGSWEEPRSLLFSASAPPSP